MGVETELLTFLLSIAFIAGLIDSIAGGGGLLVMPALLASGIPPHTVLGTQKMCSTFGTASTALIFMWKGIFKPRLWGAAVLATMIGALIGALLAHITSPEILKKVLPLVVICAAVYMLLPKNRELGRLPRQIGFRPSTKSSAFLGSGLGLYDGFAGPGTGIFWTTLSTAVYKVDIVTASGIARFMNFISNTVALTVFICLGHVDYVLGLYMGLVFLAGSFIGAHMAIHFGANFIRPIFITMVIGTASFLTWQHWIAPALITT